MFKSHPRRLFLLIFTLALLLMGLWQTSRAAPGDTIRVSVASNGTAANERSSSSSISTDGRFITFQSRATNLVAGDTNGQDDCFIHDSQTGLTSRVSIDSTGTEANANCDWPVASDDGRFIAFHSTATNLIVGDNNGVRDIFVHDRQTGQTTRISVDSMGNEADAASGYPAISADGRYIVFDSTATNLVSDDTNGSSDVFLHDRQTGQTSRVSLAFNAAEGNDSSRQPDISADGRFIAFSSDATNLVNGDNNAREDIFVHDNQTGSTIRVSLASNGAEANANVFDPAISANGRFITFDSAATNLVSNDSNGSTYDVFVHDSQTGITSLVSIASDGTAGNDESILPAISADGRYITFESTSSTLVAEATNGNDNIFMHDRVLGTTILISKTLSGTGSNSSAEAAISSDGRFIAYGSSDANLISGDSNNEADIFVYENAITIFNNAIYIPLVVK